MTSYIYPATPRKPKTRIWFTNWTITYKSKTGAYKVIYLRPRHKRLEGK